MYKLLYIQHYCCTIVLNVIIILSNTIIYCDIVVFFAECVLKNN